MPLTTQEEITKMHDQKGRKPGCRRFLALLLALLILTALLGCGTVQKWAEPIDQAGCVSNCRAAGLEMNRYVYETNACWCALPDGGEVRAGRNSWRGRDEQKGGWQ